MSIGKNQYVKEVNKAQMYLVSTQDFKAVNINT